jgi:hypothetical protein
VAVGQHVVVLADTNVVAWPNTERPDSSFYKTFADEYDQVTWPHLLAHVGTRSLTTPTSPGSAKSP